tara:strand:+ start:191 stop:730 length:540 start_codon:yes stop_codon:yes gene_type:complete
MQEKIEVKIIGIVGWSGSGKTTLMKQLLPELIKRDFRVSTMKHAHHNFEIDKPGKDSHIHRKAGAHEVLITSSQRWTILHENRDVGEPSVDYLLTRLEKVDMVLIEGFKEHSHAKIEVHRSTLGKPLLARDDPSIVAVAADSSIILDDAMLLDLNNIKEIADFIIHYFGFVSQVGNGAA